MNRDFQEALEGLNKKQLQAVKQIDGPVLVIAGPGTGKTQLLSTRVGYILQNTDTLPQNILCLTFTEAGVAAMRERLARFLDQAAYDVHISTYHAFGSELIRRYPEYAGGFGFEPIDDVGSDSLIREILDDLPYSNPLKSADTYARDLRSFMSDSKRALLTPADLRQLAKNNLDFINAASVQVSQILENFNRIDKSSPALFELLAETLVDVKSKKSAKFTSLKKICLEELVAALEQCASTGKTTPITNWKNNWLGKNEAGQFIMGGTSVNSKIAAASEVYAKYQTELTRRKLYDYDDMILRAISALQSRPDFKYTLAEQYQYIMLDEFQDTNPAQLKIVELLTDNPVNEDRPNILAVGDDDQAVYAFQGADHTNMARFAQMYRGVQVISLRENYRSHAEILDVAYNISGQIKDRLHEQFEGVTKILQQAGKDLPKQATIAHHEFISDANQYSWVASEVKRLTDKDGVSANQIAVLAPKHKYLLPLLPYLAEQNLPVRYEKRENVLDKPIVWQLEQMSRLVVALHGRDQTLIDSLWPEVLSYDFWELATDDIWEISWQADKSKTGWTNSLLGQSKTKHIAGFFLRLKDLLPTTTLEQQLDMLTGVSPDDLKAYNLPIRSPFFEFYFGKTQPKDTQYLDLLSDLSVLRGRLRQWRRSETKPLNLLDFVQFIDSHRNGNINILNSSPHLEAESAVNVMTAYQAKGREFKVVFILAAQDEVWGSASREQGSTISLPPNLSYIRYRGGSDDERLRLLYVAITRAKTHLYLTSYAATLDGKPTRPLKYLAGQAGLLAKSTSHDDLRLSTEDLQNYWHQRHIPPIKPKLKDLLEPVLAGYQLSPTHLNQFIDVIFGGPEQFFLNTILRFPKGQGTSAQYGTAIHDTLKWVHDTNAADKAFPALKWSLAFFDERLSAQRLALADYLLLQERGRSALGIYLKEAASNFDPADKFEQNFRSEGVFVGLVHMAGKIDKLVIDKKARTIGVVDFKTGKGSDKWVASSSKLHKYRQQLMAYKLLVEGSHSYAGYTVTSGTLEFVEPDETGRILRLPLEFKNDELDEFKKLITAVWQRIKSLDFPDTSKYPKTIAGIKQFETDLIKNAR